MRTMVRAVLVFAGGIVYGQAPSAQMAFELASVRPFNPSAPRSGPVIEGVIRFGPGTADPERIEAGAITVQILLREAYGVLTDQISGPGWLSDNLYQVAAKVPPGATREQMNVMLQNLLAERFKLVLHREKRSFQTWDLVVARNGPKFKETADPNAQPRLDFQRHTYTAYPIWQLISQIAANLGTPTSFGDSGLRTSAPARIANKTGLTGKYDFTFEFEGSIGLGPDADAVAGQSLFTALQEQLGLRLEAKKDLLDVLVIDHIEKVPTGN
jgi:uncharacterized protein (TIGR03435 family)